MQVESEVEKAEQYPKLLGMCVVSSPHAEVVRLNYVKLVQLDTYSYTIESFVLFENGISLDMWRLPSHMETIRCEFPTTAYGIYERQRSICKSCGAEVTYDQLIPRTD